MPEAIEVRCLNCLKRITVEPGAEKATCSSCGTEFVLSWPRPDQAKVRGLASEE